MEIAKALKNYPELRVRMGVHSGPVNEISDLNEQANIAGAGINIAQRVMDCGDAGHILLSRHVAEDLEHYPRWQAHLHDLGECEVKHGIRISVVNLYNNEIGNPALPEKFRQAKAKGQATPGLWVAVLPFRGAGDAEMESFADGLREEITTGLSRFRYLSVVASASAERVKGEAGDERALGAKLGARYVLQGSIRKGGSGIRVSAQLVDTQTGAQLWAETYNRDLQTSTIFAAQDDVAARIVATVADSYGVLVHSMRDGDPAEGRRRSHSGGVAVPVFRLPGADYALDSRRAQKPAGARGGAGRPAVGLVGLPRADLRRRIRVWLSGATRPLSIGP